MSLHVASLLEAPHAAAAGAPRVGFKPYLRAHVLSASRVALVGADEAHVLTGSIYAALSPLLDGTRDEDALAAALVDTAPPALISYALMWLEKRGFIERTSVGASYLSAHDRIEAGWWTRRGVSLEDASARLDAMACAVISVDAPTGVSTALRHLLAQRCAARLSADGMSIVLTGDYLDPKFQDAVVGAARESRLVLPARVGASELWIGPLVRAGDTGSFEAVTEWLAVNRPRYTSVASASGVRALAPAIGLPETDAFATAAIANIALASIVDRAPAKLDRAVITLDPWTLACQTHEIAVAGAPDSTGADTVDGVVALASSGGRTASRS